MEKTYDDTNWREDYAKNFCNNKINPMSNSWNEPRYNGKFQPILSFTRVEETPDPDGDPDVVINQPLTTLRGRSVLAEADFTRKDIVRIVDCVS